MEKHDSWKRTEDIEIDLADLFCRLCGQWKRLAVCALASAVLLGGYGWMKAGNRQTAVLGTEENTAAGDTGQEIPGGTDVDLLQEGKKTGEGVLSEAEEQAVADAIRLEGEIMALETYLDHSVLMQLDPYHKAKYIMLYCIEHAERQELPKITESYLNFVQNGGAADALIKFGSSWKMDKSCLAELIAAYQKIYSFPDQVVAASLQDAGSRITESLFYVEITGRNTREAEKMALDLREILEEYSGKVKETVGNHRLELLNSLESVTADSVLQSQQHDKKALLSSNKTSLKAMTDAFSGEQLAAYEAASQKGGQEETEETVSDESYDTVSGQAVVSAVNLKSTVKYTFLGFVGGVLAYCCVFSCWYVFRDTVKSMEEMKRRYTFPVYGAVLLQDAERKSGRTVARMHQDAYGCTKAQMQNRIRLSCQKQGTEKFCAASDFPLSVPEREFLENMAGQFKDWGISMTVAENISSDTAAWDSLTETGNVLMVCRIGTTTRRMIDDAMNFYLENGIAVAGAAVFLQNG